MNIAGTPSYFWITTGIFLLSYVSDYYLTIYAARFFAGHLKDHIRFEGSFELTPEFQKDVDRLRLASPNFFLRLFLSIPLLFLLWWLSSIIGLALIFEALIGGLILREAAIHLRHIRNLALALLTKNGAGITGLLRKHLLQHSQYLFPFCRVDLS